LLADVFCSAKRSVSSTLGQRETISAATIQPASNAVNIRNCLGLARATMAFIPIF